MKKHTELLRVLWTNDLGFTPETRTPENNDQPNHNHFAKITLTQLASGQHSVQLTLRKRQTYTRGSGKVFGYWTNLHTDQFLRTQQDLIVHRSFGEKNSVTSEHVFDAHALKASVLALAARIVEMAHHGQTLNATRSYAVSVQEKYAQDERARDITDQILEHLGEAPRTAERFPLLSDKRAPQQPLRPKYAHSYMPYLDAPDYATLAKNLFGIRAYRKPMAGCVQKLDPVSLSWFSLFRGLVPPEWIIDAMRAHTGKMPFEITPTKIRGIRRILVRTPAPILRRILGQRAQLAVRPLFDVVLAISNQKTQRVDLDQLPATIAARGQKNVRTAADLEHLLRSMAAEPVVLKSLRRSAATANVLMREHAILDLMAPYNRAAEQAGWEPVSWEQAQDEATRALMENRLTDHRREQMTLRQRENDERNERQRLERIAASVERAAWAEEATVRLQGAVVTGMLATVATDAMQLRQWGNTMGNCIGGYSRDIGLDLLVAFTERATGKIRINAQITHTDGVVQLLGRRNTEARKELGDDLAQQFINDLAALGFTTTANTWGTQGLVPAALQPALT